MPEFIAAKSTQNQLIAALPEEAYERLYPHLKLVSLNLGQTIYDAGQQLEYAYFPTTAIISLLSTLEDGKSAEIGIVGNDGMLGTALFMGSNTALGHAVVQSTGYALQMRPQILRSEFASGGAFQLLLLRYTHMLITQMSQNAVCNRLHTLEQQLCRRLLLSHDRLSTNELVMTQELIANTLGVRREGVTVAAGHLHRAGLIRYVRGHITILDRRGLEARACECYHVVKNECERLLKGWSFGDTQAHKQPRYNLAHSPSRLLRKASPANVPAVRQVNLSYR